MKSMDVWIINFFAKDCKYEIGNSAIGDNGKDEAKNVAARRLAHNYAEKMNQEDPGYDSHIYLTESIYEEHGWWIFKSKVWIGTRVFKRHEI